MNKYLSKYFFYYPTTLAKGELVGLYLKRYRNFQWESPENIRKYQLDRLNELLNHCYRHIPYHRELLDKIGLGNKRLTSLDELNNIPVLEKANLTSLGEKLTSQKMKLFISKKTTGGSTGQAVTIHKNSSALARERAATWRAYEWAGISIGDSQARFWGVPISVSGRLRYELINFLTNRFRFSAFDLNEERMKEYFDQICKLQPSYFYGYVSMLTTFAKFASSQNLSLPYKLKCIITTSEVLTPQDRELLKDRFNCDVFNEYGCGEVGSIAHECEHHSMHIMSDNLIIETINENSDDAGNIIVTDLFNYAMPLIRYSVGDMGTLSNKTCDCGRTLPVLEKIHGRAYDFLVDSSGKKYHPELIMYVFEELKDRNFGISQFQVIQNSPSQLEVSIIKGNTFNQEFEPTLIDRLGGLFNSPMDITFSYVDEIPRESSGKLRLIKRTFNE